MTTVPFGPRNPADDPLLARAAELPQEVAPSRDLWPGIAARIAQDPDQRSRRPRWPLALAAGAAIAAVSALLTFSLVRGTGPAVTAASPPAAETGLMPVRYGANARLTPAELAVRDELYQRFSAKLAELRPETRATIEKNLAVMQQAADEIDAALAKDPASGFLNGLLVGTYKQELQLYSKVVTAGDGSRRRT